MKAQVFLASLSASTALAGVLPSLSALDQLPKGGDKKTDTKNHGEVVCDFEDPKLFEGAAGALAKNGGPAVDIYEGYCGLHYDSFSVGGPAVVNGLYGRGEAYAIARNTAGASFMVDYTGSHTPAFTPKSVYTGCFLATKSGLSPAISCSIRVEPEGDKGQKFEPASKTCEFKTSQPAGGDLLQGVATGVGSQLFNLLGVGIANVQECDLPESWEGVSRLTFKLDETLIPDLSPVLSTLGLGEGFAGSVGFVVDDFSRKSYGFKGDAANGDNAKESVPHGKNSELEHHV